MKKLLTALKGALLATVIVFTPWSANNIEASASSVVVSAQMNFDEVAFYGDVRGSLFGGRLTSRQVSGIEGIFAAFRTHGDGSIKTLAYALATAFHETGRLMVPVREGFASTDAGARRVVAHRKYGKQAGPYGHVYYGRGQVQLTWLDNYARSSKDAGIDLVRFPDAALDPVIGARILIRGLVDGRWNGHRKGIAHYLPRDGRDDLCNARRTVNIIDRCDLIGRYYQKFLAALIQAT